MLRTALALALAVAAATLGTVYAQTAGAPAFESAGLDWSTNILTVSFDREINLDTVDLSKLHVREPDETSGGVTLSGSNIRLGMDDSYVYSSAFGRDGTNHKEFRILRGMAVNSTGHIFVTEQGNNRVQIFDHTGGHVRTIGGIDSGQGTHQFWQPRGIAVNSTGHIFVADALNHRVQIFDRHYNHVHTIGTGGHGSADDEFNQPRSIAINSTGHIFVTDKDNHRIKIFDPSGALVGKIGKTEDSSPVSGSENGDLNDPQGIAIDSRDRIIIVDKGNHRVQIFGSDGAYIDKIGKIENGIHVKGGENGTFDGPEDVAVDSFDSNSSRF